MANVTLSTDKFVIFEGTASKGKNAGKPYAFLKLDFKFSNDAAIVAQLKQAGVKVINGASKNAGQPTQPSLLIS